jgi:HK97 family phage prohead protease
MDNLAYDISDDLVFKALDVIEDEPERAEKVQYPVLDVDVEKRTIKGLISTPDMDRDGEVVPVEAFQRDLDVYMTNPILILHHHHKSLPVGKCLNVEPKPPEGLWGEFYVSKTPQGEEVLTLLSEGCLRGFSTGFIPLEWEDNPAPDRIPSMSMKTSNGRRCKKIYRRVELVEVSLLAIPSNRRALLSFAEKGNEMAQLIIKGYDPNYWSDDPDIFDEMADYWADLNRPVLKWLLDTSIETKETKGLSALIGK